MKILITGIAGSGGSYLAEYLVNEFPQLEIHGIFRWHSTTNQDNLKSIREKIVMHQCDMCDLPSLIRVMREVKPDRIFNLASHANVRVAFDTPIAVLQNNIMSTANLLEAIRLECPGSYLQHCSTSEVYGNPAEFPMTENHPLKPVNPYSVSKLTQEALCHAYAQAWKIKTITTRAFCYINPRRRDLFATSFAYQIAEIEAGKRDILHHGNLASIRTIQDVRDSMRAYWMAFERGTPGEFYNIGGTEILSVGDFLNRLIKHAKCYIPVEQDKNLLRPVDVTKQVPDTSKFITETGFKPKYSLDDSIDFLLNHVRKEINK